MGLICAWECHRKARKAGAGPVVHPAPWLTHYPSCPFILPNLLHRSLDADLYYASLGCSLVGDTGDEGAVIR